MLALTNFKIITKDAIREDLVIIIKGNIVYQFISKDNYSHLNSIPSINGQGSYLAPGLIDIHTDAVELSISPRKNIKFGLKEALIEIDKSLLMNGITTAYHSLSLTDFTVAGLRRTITTKDMLQLAELIRSESKNLFVTHRYHARLELTSIDLLDRIVDMIDDRLIDQLSFMDHTPGQGQYSSVDKFRTVLLNQHGKLTSDECDILIDKLMSREKLSEKEIMLLIAKAKEYRIPTAFHDVDSYEKVDILEKYCIDICEFPTKLDVSAYSKEKGLYNVVGSPNLIRGQSIYGNMSATQAVKKGLVDIICSDYKISTLLPSIFKLSSEQNIMLHDLMQLVTINPAIALKISHKVGSIEIGKVADLIFIKVINNYPHVQGMIKNGKVLFNLLGSMEDYYGGN